MDDNVEEERNVFSNLSQDHIADENMQKYSSFSFEFYHVVPNYDEYSDDDLDILEFDVSMVMEFDQQIHEGIQFIIYEQPESMYVSQFVDYHDGIVDVSVQGTCDQIQGNLDAFDFQCPKNLHTLFPADQMKYHLISEAEEQCDLLYQLEMQHSWQDPMVVYIEMVFS
jgi:hypothetical protein